MASKIVIFTEQGYPAAERPGLPDNHVPFPAETALTLDDGRVLAPDGSYRWFLLGVTCYGGADGRTMMTLPMDTSLAGKGWDDLANLKSPENPYGILRAPRPLTKAEQYAADAEAEAAAVAALEMSAVQARLAANQMSIREEIDAVMASAETPRDLKDLWEYSPTYKRAHPAWDVMAGHIGKTPADVTAWFRLGATL